MARKSAVAGPSLRGPREKQYAMSRCHAIGCAEILPGTAIFCERHLAMLWPDIATKLMQKFRPGRPPSKVYNQLLERAMFEILRYQQTGHRAPRAVDFEWDDPPASSESTDVSESEVKR